MCTQSLNRTASWVVIDRATGVALFETFTPVTLSITGATYLEAVPILEYLQRLNSEINQRGIKP